MIAIRRRYGWLAQLEEFVRTNMENDCRALDVVPTLVTYNQSLLHNLRIYVEEARLVSESSADTIYISRVQQHTANAIPYNLHLYPY